MVKRRLGFLSIMALGVSSILISCLETKPAIGCHEGNILFNDLLKYNGYVFKNVSATDTNLVIQSEKQFEHYIASGAILPKVNFASQTVLAGRTFSPVLSSTITQSVKGDCENRKVKFAMNLQRGAAPSATYSYYMISIPKLGKDVQVDFEVKYIN